MSLAKRHANWTTGDYAALPSGRIAVILAVNYLDDRAHLRYVQREDFHDEVTIRLGLLRTPSARELFAAGIEP